MTQPDYKNLEVLYVVGNSVNDHELVHLGGLSKLEKLTLVDTGISDLSEIVKLTTLSELSVAKNNISSIDNISNLDNLHKLSLSENRIDDLTALNSNLRRLQEIRLDNNQITDIASLNQISTLTSLGLSFNNIRYFGSLETHENHENISCYDGPNNRDPTLGQPTLDLCIRHWKESN